MLKSDKIPEQQDANKTTNEPGERDKRKKERRRSNDLLTKEEVELWNDDRSTMPNRYQENANNGSLDDKNTA